MAFKDYRKHPIKPLKDGGFAIFTKNGKTYFTASRKDTLDEVKRLAREWTAQSAYSVIYSCESEWIKLGGNESEWRHIMA